MDHAVPSALFWSRLRDSDYYALLKANYLNIATTIHNVIVIISFIS